MLGISLDSNICKCKIRTQCTISQCECISYCTIMNSIYELINPHLLQRCFLTFSPTPKTAAGAEFGESPYKEFKTFVKSFLKSDNIEEYIAVPELTLKGQIHYHVYLKFKNKVTFIKQVIQPLYHRGNVLPIYGSPKEGLHYLFKSSNLMFEYMGDKLAIMST